MLVSTIKQQSWLVLAPVRGGKYKEYVAIDIVYFDSDMIAEDVKRCLVNHDGYDPDIQVKKRPSHSKKD